MARTSRRRSRQPYRAPDPAGDPATGLPGSVGGRPARRPAYRQERGGSGLPLLPLSLAGLAVGLVVVAALALGGGGPSGSLATPDASYPAENADLSLGASDAPVTVAEWADFQCPACGAYAKTIEPRLIETYVKPGKVRLVFHNFAFLGAESTSAATAALCAGEQGRFWPYHGYVYANQSGENQGAFRTERLRDIARATGLDMDTFDSCLSGGTARSRVVAETSEAQRAGITRTPTIVVGNQPALQGVPRWEQFQAVIEADLAAGS